MGVLETKLGTAVSLGATAALILFSSGGSAPIAVAAQQPAVDGWHTRAIRLLTAIRTTPTPTPRSRSAAPAHRAYAVGRGCRLYGQVMLPWFGFVLLPTTNASIVAWNLLTGAGLPTKEMKSFFEKHPLTPVVHATGPGAAARYARRDELSGEEHRPNILQVGELRDKLFKLYAVLVLHIVLFFVQFFM